MANRQESREKADDRGARTDRLHERAEDTPAAADEAAQRDIEITRLKPGEPTMPDEAGDVSIANADHPRLVREDNTNTSDSSGLRAGDEAAGQQIKELLRRGAQEVTRMD